VELTEADAGGETAVGVSGDVVLRLAENRTTGYSWQLSLPAELAVLDDTFEAGEATAPGAGGVRTFRLRATAPGSHRVAAALRRPWESGPGSGRALEFTVRAN
jgi:inhibitor of cysteine peptidase